MGLCCSSAPPELLGRWIYSDKTGSGHYYVQQGSCGCLSYGSRGTTVVCGCCEGSVKKEGNACISKWGQTSWRYCCCSACCAGECSIPVKGDPKTNRLIINGHVCRKV